MTYMVTATTPITSYDPYRYSNYPVLINYTATAPITSLWSILLQQLSCLYDLYCYSNYYVLMIYTVTTHITSLWTILSQQLLRLYDLYGYSNYHVFTIGIVTATITSSWSILLQHLPHLYELYCYSNYYVFMIYMVTATITSLQSICHSNYVFMINLVTAYYVLMITIPGERPPCTHSRDWRTPARCAIPGAARRTPRQTSKTMPFVLSYCFFCFAICVIRYLPNWRP